MSGTRIVAAACLMSAVGIAMLTAQGQDRPARWHPGALAPRPGRPPGADGRPGRPGAQPRPACAYSRELAQELIESSQGRKFLRPFRPPGLWGAEFPGFHPGLYSRGLSGRPMPSATVPRPNGPEERS